MNGDTSSSAIQGSGLLRMLLLALVVMLAMLGYYRSTQIDMTANDDNLIWYVNAMTLSHPDETLSIIKQVGQHVKANSSEVVAWRYKMRTNQTKNYLALSFGLNTARTLFFSHPSQGGLNYPQFLSLVISIGFFLAYLVVVLVYVAMLGSTGSRRAILVLGLTLAFILMLNLVPISFFVMKAERAGSVGELLQDFGSLLISPNMTFYSTFYYTPRALITLGVIFMFAFRWTGRHTLAYWMFPIFSLIHVSQSLLVVILVVATDIVLRPQLFAKLRNLLPIGVWALMFGAFESRWDMASENVMIGLTVAAVAVALAVLVVLYIWVRFSPTLAHDSPIARLIQGVRWAREKLLSRGDVLADLMVILAILIVSMPIVLMSFANSPIIQAKYLWGEFYPRYLGIVRPLLFLGLAWGIVAIWVRPGRRFLAWLPETAVATACVLAIAVSVMIAKDDSSPGILPDLLFKKMFEWEQAINAGLPTPVTYKDEHRIFYAIARVSDQKILQGEAIKKSLKNNFC